MHVTHACPVACCFLATLPLITPPHTPLPLPSPPQVIHAALALEPALLGPIREALLRATSPLSRDLLAAARPWDTPLLLQPVLAAWVEQQSRGFMVWVRRQLEGEKWRPVGGQQVRASRGGRAGDGSKVAGTYATWLVTCQQQA